MKGKEVLTSKSPQGSTVDMAREEDGRDEKVNADWHRPASHLALATGLRYTTPNTHVTNHFRSPRTTIMSSSDAQDDYDKLSPEEREIRDKADRQREAEEQAGMNIILGPTHIHLTDP
jgi:hypothetical protein